MWAVDGIGAFVLYDLTGHATLASSPADRLVQLWPSVYSLAAAPSVPVRSALESDHRTGRGCRETGAPATSTAAGWLWIGVGLVGAYTALSVLPALAVTAIHWFWITAGSAPADVHTAYAEESRSAAQNALTLAISGGMLAVAAARTKPSNPASGSGD